MIYQIWRHAATLSALAALSPCVASVAAPPMSFTVVSSAAKTLTPAKAAAADRDTTPGIVSVDRKILTFRRKTVRLVARSGPESDMLSYRISGLRNPTLVVPSGATLRVRFINTEDDMSHNLRFGAHHTASEPSVGTATLAHKTATAYQADDVTVRVPSAPGTYSYLCTVRGHAPGGMWGTIIVR